MGSVTTQTTEELALFDAPRVVDGNAIQSAVESIVAALDVLDGLDVPERIVAINAVRREVHARSPFAREPVDCVQWVPIDNVRANDYNPNTVAPPEMRLLERSILEDGYTQPIVAWYKDDGGYEVVDGFHRNRVGQEVDAVRQRILGHLPLSIINPEREQRGDRIAATIRHNRARGKHQVGAMSEIVVELKRRNWTDERIARELGMDQDEILRLCQITGLGELFSDQEFSKSWDVEGEVCEADFAELSDDAEDWEQTDVFRTVNTSDPDRIFHTFDKWECYRAGFYSTTKAGMSADECEEAYREFLSDTSRFADALEHITTEWKHSCEQYLTNKAMNRIAWLGQAATCYATGVPATFRAGFHRLTDDQQQAANETALVYLNRWMEANDREPVTLEDGLAGRQVDLY